MVWIIIACIVLVIAAICIIQAKNRQHFVVKNYIFRNAKIKGQGFRLVILSDLHNKCYGQDNEELIKAIDDAYPDMIICAGDMITAVKGQKFDGYMAGSEEKADSGTEEHTVNDDNTELSYDGSVAVSRPDYKSHNTYRLLEQLAKKYQVFYGLGNHESRMYRRRETFGTGYEDLISTLKSMGIFVLVNEHHTINVKNNKICITGLDIAGIYYKRFAMVKMPEDYLPIKLGEPDAEAINLLIAHNPDYFERYKEWGADVSFAGHLHGGVMRIPGIGGVISPQFHLFPKYSGDMYVEDGKAIVVSKGIGEHTMPLRINNPAEVVVLDVVASEL